MDMPFYLSVLIGFVPSFAILYIVWGKFEGVFNEKRLFWNYFVGWILGILIAIFFLMIKYSVSPYLDMSILFVVFFAIFTVLVKFIYLNFPKKLKDYQLPYNGFALGLGIAALWGLAMSYQILAYSELSNSQLILYFTSLLIMSTALAPFNPHREPCLGTEFTKRRVFCPYTHP